MNSYYIVKVDKKTKELLVLSRLATDALDVHRSFQTSESAAHEFIAFHDSYEGSRTLRTIQAGFRAVGLDGENFQLWDSEVLAGELTNQILRKQKEHAVARAK